MRSFHGAVDVFGIVTTMDEWKLAWFPHTDAAAKCDVLAAHDELVRPHPVDLNTDRIVYATDIFVHHDPILTRIIMSVIRKAMNTPYEQVPVLSPERMYIRLTHSSWQWRRHQAMAITRWKNKLTLAFSATTKKTTEFNVLKYLHCGPKCKVSAAICGDSLTACVVKQTVSVAAANEEVRLWMDVNGLCSPFTCTVFNSPAIVMPFAVLAKVTDGRVWFDFEVRSWSLQDSATAGPTPPSLERLAEQMKNAASSAGLLDARVVADAAVAACAARKVVHTDLAWRHIGLLPVFDTRGSVSSMQPVLIDFERTEVAPSVDQAQGIMAAKVEQLSEGLAFG